MNSSPDLNLSQNYGAQDGAGNVTVFLVDDDAVVLSTLHMGLQQRGYKVSCFSTGEAALEAWRVSPPDAAIVDVGLPDITGGDLVAKLLATAHRPILALSQYHDKIVVDELVSKGVMNYLVKPVSANQLIPPVQAMLSTSRRFNNLKSHQTPSRQHDQSVQLAAVLDQFSFGVLLIDANHQVIKSNFAADKMLAQADVPLALVEQHLDASDPVVALSFRQMIARALRVDDQEQSDSSGAEVMAVPRADGAAALQLWISPLSQNNHAMGFESGPGSDAVIVVMVDPDADTPVATTLLRSLFGLTAAESKLAAALVNGMSIENYAKATNVSYNTARSHLKSIFVKTRTHRQVDLVILLSKLLGNLQSGTA